MKTFFIVMVEGCSPEEAEKVMTERIDHEEDYGFDYQINSWTLEVDSEKFARGFLASAEAGKEP